MSRRRQLKGVLHNFLGTLSSRYSDFDGYWLFGFLIESLDQSSINLLDENVENSDVAPIAFFKRLAAQKFAEQIAKAGLSRSWIREAHLDISRSPEARFGRVNGQDCYRYDVRFMAHIETDLGKFYKAYEGISVAPHNPNVERRSARAHESSPNGHANSSIG